MITVRRSAERGHADYGWLNTYHTFSFADYYDPAHMGFRALRVINEDRVAPGQGFGEHPHRDMEIVSYVLEGALEHKDSMGHGAVLRPGEFQRMTAGTGVRHSEFNPSPTEPVHFYQIWLMPRARNLEPGYEQRAFSPDGKRNKLRLVAAPQGRDDSLTINQDVEVYLGNLDSGAKLTHRLAADRFAWLQVLRGAVRVNDTALATSDGAAVEEVTDLQIAATEPAEVMLFDLT